VEDRAVEGAKEIQTALDGTFTGAGTGKTTKEALANADKDLNANIQKELDPAVKKVEDRQTQYDKDIGHGSRND